MDNLSTIEIPLSCRNTLVQILIDGV